MVQIANHAHCSICGKAIPYGDKVCGNACQEKLDDLNRRRKRTMYMMYGLMAVAFAVLALSLINPGLMGGG